MQLIHSYLFWISVCILLTNSATSETIKESSAVEFDQTSSTVTVTEGQTIYLDCKVHRKGEKTVTWVRHHGGSIELITYGLDSFHDDRRFSLRYEPPENWRLRLVGVSRRDAGRYDCQISSHPPLKKTVILTVTDPSIRITDSGGSPVNSELYVREGSPVTLGCIMEPVSVYNKKLPLWKANGYPVIHSTDNLLIERKREENKFIIWLHIMRIRPRDGVRYNCGAAEADGETVKLHVINEEHYSPIHGNNGRTSRSWNEINVLLLLLLPPAIHYIYQPG